MKQWKGQFDPHFMVEKWECFDRSLVHPFNNYGRPGSESMLHYDDEQLCKKIIRISGWDIRQNCKKIKMSGSDPLKLYLLKMLSWERLCQSHMLRYMMPRTTLSTHTRISEWRKLQICGFLDQILLNHENGQLFGSDDVKYSSVSMTQLTNGERNHTCYTAEQKELTTWLALNYFKTKYCDVCDVETVLSLVWSKCSELRSATIRNSHLVSKLRIDLYPEQIL